MYEIYENQCFPLKKQTFLILVVLLPVLVSSDKSHTETLQQQ
jgi:hypothetical protein